MRKYIPLAFTAISLFSFVGCAGLSQKSYKAQEEHLAFVDKKIQELEQSVLNLNTSAQNLGRRIEELSQKSADVEGNYSKLNTSLDELRLKADTKDSSHDAILSDAQRAIDDLVVKLSEIEKAKADLQNQIAVLQAQRVGAISSPIEQQSEAIKEEAREMREQGREMVKEAKAEQKLEGQDKKVEALAIDQQKEALQKILEDALVLYRDGNYKEAVSKWEEALVIDPENLEAKFNIEIAKEKMKSISEK